MRIFPISKFMKVATRIFVSSSVTKDNYFTASKGVFEAVDKNEFAKYIPENWNEKKSWNKSVTIYGEKFDFNHFSWSERYESVSVYYVNESESKMVRISDHWSGIKCDQVASCDWKLNDDSQSVEMPKLNIFVEDSYSHEIKLKHQIIGRKAYCGIVDFSNMRSNFTDFPVAEIENDHYVNEIMKEMTEEDWNRFYDSGAISMAGFLSLYDNLDIDRMIKNNFELILPYNNEDRKKLDRYLIQLYVDGKIRKIEDFLNFVDNEDKQFLFFDLESNSVEKEKKIKKEIFNVICDNDNVINKKDNDLVNEIYDFFIVKNLFG